MLLFGVGLLYLIECLYCSTRKISSTAATGLVSRVIVSWCSQACAYWSLRVVCHLLKQNIRTCSLCWKLLLMRWLARLIARSSKRWRGQMSRVSTCRVCYTVSSFHPQNSVFYVLFGMIAATHALRLSSADGMVRLVIANGSHAAATSLADTVERLRQEALWQM